MTESVNAIAAAIALICVGLYGLAVTRHLIKLTVALQLMSKGALILIITAGVVAGRLALVQSIATTAIVVDTLTTVILLAFAIRVQQKFGTLDLRELGALKG
jgi:multisubunit Na+/H+ antiporter MnhC subunit